MKHTAIIMLHYGMLLTTKRSLKKLSKKIGTHSLILINNTQEDLGGLASIIPRTTIIQNSSNLGFAKGVNQGIEAALKDKRVDSIFLMNNDLELTFGTIDMLRKNLTNKQAIITPVLKHSGDMYDWGGKLNKVFGSVKHLNFKQKPKKVIQVNHVAGAAMLISRSLIEEIGLFDERFFLYFEDLDYCIRTNKAGYTIHIDSEIVADHQVSAASLPLKRTLHQWLSHVKFIFKHMPATVLPTAILYNLIFYPLVLLKLIIKKFTSN